MFKALQAKYPDLAKVLTSLIADKKYQLGDEVAHPELNDEVQV